MLVLRFDEPLDPAWAQNPRNYHLVPLEGPRRMIHFRRAVYDAAAHTVTLMRPPHHLNIHNLFRLTVMGAGRAA